MEIAWGSFDEMIAYGEGLLKHIVKKVLQENKAELKLLERDTKLLQPTTKKPFVRMTYDQALKILKDKCKMKVEWGKDLRTIEEEKLTQFSTEDLLDLRCHNVDGRRRAATCLSQRRGKVGE